MKTWQIVFYDSNKGLYTHLYRGELESLPSWLRDHNLNHWDVLSVEQIAEDISE